MNINKLITPIDIREFNYDITKDPVYIIHPNKVRELEGNYREAMGLLNRIQKVVNGRGDNVTKVGKVKDLLI